MKNTLRLASPAKLKFLITAVVMLLIVPGAEIMAQGNLLISPQRVIFEGSRKSLDLNLANTGNDTSRYVISLVEIRMKDDGSFEEITQPDSGQNFADKYLRIFPKSVTLAPKEAQVVKVQVVRSNELATGEYRSHLYFRAVPDEDPAGEKKSNDSSGIAVRLKLVYGITIPVIIRVGGTDASVNISDLSLKMVNDTLPRLWMAFNRTGNRSVYGNLAVNFTSPDGKVTTQVGIARGISVYTPNAIRRFHIDLMKVPGIDYHSGKLTVEYTDESTARHALLADAQLPLN